MIVLFSPLHEPREHSVAQYCANMIQYVTIVDRPSYNIDFP